MVQKGKKYANNNRQDERAEKTSELAPLRGIRLRGRRGESKIESRVKSEKFFGGREVKDRVRFVRLKKTRKSRWQGLKSDTSTSHASVRSKRKTNIYTLRCIGCGRKSVF